MKVLVVGAGAVGKALASIIGKYHQVTMMDLEAKTALPDSYDVMHICFPFSKTFVEDVMNYIGKFNPSLLLIESTVVPGTTMEIFKRKTSTTLLCHSPVRGRHAELEWGLKNYSKFIGPCTQAAGIAALNYYQDMEFKTYIAKGPAETEIAKLANLSYYAVQIAFFQELDRKMKEENVNASDVELFMKTTTEESGGKVQRPILEPGYIGGTCVMPGLRLLFERSNLSRWIEESNKKCS